MAGSSHILSPSSRYRVSHSGRLLGEERCTCSPLVCLNEFVQVENCTTQWSSNILTHLRLFMFWIQRSNILPRNQRPTNIPAVEYCTCPFLLFVIKCKVVLEYDQCKKTFRDLLFRFLLFIGFYPCCTFPRTLWTYQIMKAVTHLKE